MRRIKSLALSSLASVLLSYCGASEDQVSPELAQQEASAPADQEEIPPPPEPEPLPPGLAPIAAPWTGDLPGMAERRVVRFLVVQSPVLYFVDKGRELGLTYESIKAFEEHLNESLGTGHVKVHAVPVPVSRNELIPKLLSGEGDIAAATLTITPDRLGQVDFSDPLAREIDEIVVTGAGSVPASSLDQLSGKEIHVRLSSSYAEHLKALNDRLASEGKAPVEIVPADEILEDGDLIEMVAAGLIPATVADSFIAELWKEVFTDIVLHGDAPVSTGGDIAWAFRKDSPELAKMVNTFVKNQKQGSLMGNILIKKYLKTTKWVKNARSEEDIARFRSMVDLFEKYAGQYEFDWLLMVAQGYQESGLDQSVRSHVGAIGVMQVMPETARDQAVNIPDIENLESNIHAGIKYNRWVVDNFFSDPAIRPLDQALLAFASYNAGPGRVRSLRREAEEQGLDPNRWFNNVELIAAKRIGRETVQYVSNIYKYYIAYQLVLRQEERREKARVSGP
ncbi:MAG TPA: lytic transglycosylase F [Vicinamibacteria bacterium]|nr:lytic transglycosylase F [Vicinamibacteria bacterium]